MQDYSKTVQDLYSKIRHILDKYELDAGTFLQDSHPNNSKAHSEILAVLADTIPTTPDRYGVTMANRDYINDIFENNREDCKFKDIPDFKLGKLVKTYLVDLYGHFYNINDGVISFTHNEDFALPSVVDNNPDHEANMQYIESRVGASKHDTNTELCLLLMPDGKIYYAEHDHLTLAYWLNLNNVDLHSAIRVESTKSLGDFSFTSLYNYKFSESSDTDELISISHPQSQNLALIYGALKHGWRYMRPLAGELRKTTGFGFGKNEHFEDGGLASKNLRRLHMYMLDFDLGEYVREMRLSNSAHSPLLDR